VRENDIGALGELAQRERLGHQPLGLDEAPLEHGQGRASHGDEPALGRLAPLVRDWLDVLELVLHGGDVAELEHGHAVAVVAGLHGALAVADGLCELENLLGDGQALGGILGPQDRAEAPVERVGQRRRIPDPPRDRDCLAAERVHPLPRAPSRSAPASRARTRARSAVSCRGSRRRASSRSATMRLSWPARAHRNLPP
jgi:hypothetical protein